MKTCGLRGCSFLRGDGSPLDTILQLLRYFCTGRALSIAGGLSSLSSLRRTYSYRVSVSLQAARAYDRELLRIIGAKSVKSEELNFPVTEYQADKAEVEQGRTRQEKRKARGEG